MTRQQAEINVAQVIGEIRGLVLYQILHMNPTLSFTQAQKLAEEEVADIFSRLEEAYREYFLSTPEMDQEIKN